jgi:hypothetical protein
MPKPSAIVLSVPAGDTGELVSAHDVHACPERYRYRSDDLITVRPEGGRMEAIYRVEYKFVAHPEDPKLLDKVRPEDRQRVRSYVDQRQARGLFYDEPFRFYVFSRDDVIELTARPQMERNAQGHCYFTVGELTSGRSVVQLASRRV